MKFRKKPKMAAATSSSATNSPRQTWMRWLRIVHFCMLVSIASCFTLLRAIYGETDQDIRKLGILISVVAVSWAAALAIAGIATGSQDSTSKFLKKSYNRLLSGTVFLHVSTAVLIAIESVLVWGLVAFSPVEFYANEDVELILSDRPGSVTSLGHIGGGSVSTIRLKTGLRSIGFHVASTGEFSALPPIEVTAWWTRTPHAVVRIPEVKRYEPLN